MDTLRDRNELEELWQPRPRAPWRGMDVIDGRFWRGRRVLLTGHTGFKGGWLCLWLQALGAERERLSR